MNLRKERLDMDVKMASEEIKVDMLKKLPTPVMAIDRMFNITYLNDHGLELIGHSNEEVIGKKCYDVFNSSHCKTENCRLDKSMTTGERYTARNEANIEGKIIPIEYTTSPLLDNEDNIVGGLEFITDITDRVLYENKLKEQSATIREMSTPTIKLWKDILVLPIVGVVDSIRAQHMMDSILNKILETSSKVVILDIHGVVAVDTAVANHLIKITKATRLMGCDCLLSGISPAVAQTIIQLGIDMSSIRSYSTLSDSLAEAFKLINMQVIQTNL